jgi:phage regulator Rha-like protein
MNTLITIPPESILGRIFLIRGKKIMLDSDLANIYEVLTKELNKSVNRNIARFPEDFMFRLTKEEYASLRFQFGTSNMGRGGRRYLPLAFTEQGVAMLSTVLHSERAIQMNIQIIRTFTRLREILSENKHLAEKIDKMERKYDKHIADIFKVIKSLVTEKEISKIQDKPKEKLGFEVPE